MAITFLFDQRLSDRFSRNAGVGKGGLELGIGLAVWFNQIANVTGEWVFFLLRFTNRIAR